MICLWVLFCAADHNGDMNGHAGEGEELVAFPGLNAPIPANADPALWFGQPPQVRLPF